MRGARARYQLCAAARPPDLDDRLSERGYVVDAPTLVQTASLADVLEGANARAVAVTERPDPAWSRIAWPDPVRRKNSEAVLARVGPVAAYALARVDAAPCAVALGVVERGFIGISCVRTEPEFEGRGAARALLGALARFGEKEGATSAYLQVEESNAAARSLYARAGFATLYRYHYRCEPQRL